MTNEQDLARGKELGCLAMQLQGQKIDERIEVRDCLFSVYAELAGTAPNDFSVAAGRVHPRVRYKGDITFLLRKVNEDIRDASGVPISGTRNYDVFKLGEFQVSLYNVAGFQFESRLSDHYPLLTAPYLQAAIVSDGNLQFVTIESRVPLKGQKPAEESRESS
jgi:hypothetical protein